MPGGVRPETSSIALGDHLDGARLRPSRPSVRRWLKGRELRAAGPLCVSRAFPGQRESPGCGNIEEFDDPKVRRPPGRPLTKYIPPIRAACCFPAPPSHPPFRAAKAADRQSPGLPLQCTIRRVAAVDEEHVGRPDPGDPSLHPPTWAGRLARDTDDPIPGRRTCRTSGSAATRPASMRVAHRVAPVWRRNDESLH